MANLQAGSIRTGDFVRVRRRRWRVLDIVPYDDCQLVTLASAGDARRVLAPFDAIERLERRAGVKVVSRRRWRRVCRSLIATHTPAGSLRAARRARIDLLPHQLEPALAIVRGLGSRLLLADDVGLGKTIQAGLAVSELHERRIAERTLIVTPAGLRDQWSDELSRRFDLAPVIVDAPAVRRRLVDLPVGVNPWTCTPIAIASIDYIKRPETLTSILGCRWDLLIVDEAHNAAGGSDRHEAIAAIAARCPYVLLLTATPHSGDRRAFAALCDIGEHGDPLLVFRRTRAGVGAGPPRRVHVLAVRPTAAERRMHSLVAQITRVVRDMNSQAPEAAALALAVLNKRALSSAWSLHQTVTRRLDALGADESYSAGQPMLPMFDEGEHDEADRPPELEGLSLGDPDRERALLSRVAEAAGAAAAHESKIAALSRLLRRAREPAIVFTEYRDTLLHLQRTLDRSTTVLHGGLSRPERHAALSAFTSGQRSVLLATDAAAEGLNLQERCRLVVNLELPWNPVRLEQRAGRVDRIGQRRRVHAVHLVSRSTAERRILAALGTRVARAAADIGAADPLGEAAVAALVIDGTAPCDEGRHPRSTSERVSVDLRTEASAEAVRLVASRRFGADDDALARRVDRPWLTFIRSSRARRAYPSSLILLYVVACEDEAGRSIESTLLPTVVRLSEPLSGRAAIDSVLRLAQPELLEAVESASIAWRQQAESISRQLVVTRLARERAIASRLETHRGSYQPGLFDRRAERDAGSDRDGAEAVRAAAARRLHAIERSFAISIRHELWLVLAP